MTTLKKLRALAKAKKRVKHPVIKPGDKFTYLTVLKTRTDKTSFGGYKHICRCICGKLKSVPDGALKSKSIASCGCKTRSRTHGMTDTKTWQAWRSMRERCENKNHRAYKNYGGRGIGICMKWKKFEKFLADMGVAPENLSLDRIDNNKGYSPKNCRWATRAEQNSNTRRSRIVTIDGKDMTLGDAAKKLGMKYKTLHKQISENRFLAALEEK